MFTSPVQLESPVSSQLDDRAPVVFAPLDEATAYRRLDEYFQREADRRALSQAAGIEDDALIEALLDAGFNAETLPALQLAPIAFAAWASDTVTDEESRAAVWSIYECRLFEHPKSASRVQSWLDDRPSEELWDLWFAYTQCRLRSTPGVIRQVVGKQLLEHATAVALASGGFMGVGNICDAEQEILDSIRNVYRL